MKTKLFTRFMSLLLITLMMIPTMMPAISVIAAEDITTYLFNPGTFADVNGTKLDGDTDTGGTDNFFTLHYKSGTKVESNAKSFDDGFTSTKRVDFQGGISFEGLVKGAISFTTQASAEIKIWWGCAGDGRQVSVFDEGGSKVTQTAEESIKNELYISTLNVSKAGTYYIGGEENCYIYKITVTTKTIDKGPRDSWDKVAAPTFASIKTNEDGKIAVSVNALVDHHGADYLTVNMIQNGKVVSTVKSTSLKSVHNLLFSPVESGTYSFQAIITRAGEADKKSATSYHSYTLPLAVPFITNCANLGNGQVELIWNPSREADGYNVYVGPKGATTLYQYTTDRNIVVSGLTNGSTVYFEVEAVRGNKTSERYTVSLKVGAADRGWDFTVYGPSTNSAENTYTKKADGSVIVASTNGKGKLQPTGADGLAYYYTAIPADQNFTFRVTAVVNFWRFSNGQDGFGIMATDHVPSSDYTTADFWTNQYMAACTKIEYRYEDVEDGGYNLYTTDSILGDKYSMKLGIGSISKVGINQSIIDRTALGETGLIVGQTGALQTVVETLECRAGLLGKKAGTYNIIGNCRNEENLEGNLSEYLLTEITLEIQKNNTGYFITYYDKNGNVVRTIKNYDPDALEQFDSDYVYIGMFASRNASVTFKDIEIITINEEDDLPPEERPITKVEPMVTFTSTTATTTTNYELIADFNLDGTIDVMLNNKKILENVPVKAYERLAQIIDLSEYGSYLTTNKIRVDFTPDPDQELPEYTELATTNTQYFTLEVSLYKGAEHRKNVYVSPNGTYNGNGSKEYPYDIYSAIDRAVPGQTIILMEGTYKLQTGLRIQRGINGTEENPIRMIADPEATTRPVLDFLGIGTGITHGGNWWYFYGFDVTNSLDGQKGFQVSGNNNVLDQIHAHHNGNTGIQISRYATVDLTIDQWPSNNLILNCTSWANADSGYEDADGFAAKLTIGEGNVFDGCVAYNNADDGWDLFAKIATGPIGSVVIRNCVAYANGYLENGELAGNGNGFKMGGDSLSGHHQLINSIAFNNRAKGIDSNSCPDIIVKNCISYNNGSHNVAFYTNSALDTDFVATGIISFKDNKISADELAVKENFKPKGNQDVEKYDNASNFYWNGTTSANNLGQTIGADIFVSLEFKGITRNADGTINMQGFLELKSNTPSGAGTTGASTPSAVIELLPNEECHYSTEWTNTDMYLHWHECECGDKTDLGEHDLVLVVDREATPEKAGLNHYECSVCGHKRPQNEFYYEAPVEPAPTGIAGFFAAIIEAILNFFRMLFGIK